MVLRGPANARPSHSTAREDGHSDDVFEGALVGNPLGRRRVETGAKASMTSISAVHNGYGDRSPRFLRAAATRGVDPPCPETLVRRVGFGSDEDSGETKRSGRESDAYRTFDITSVELEKLDL